MPDVILSPGAIEDILSVHNHILEHAGEAQAKDILQRLETRCFSLQKFPMRGKRPDELIPFGNQIIREIQEKPWRIFYRLDPDKIVVLAVLDGRRSMQDILFERLAR